jgi:hypothetical protein
MLASKILNYRAIDQLNQRRYAEALSLALKANEARASLLREAEGGSGGFRIGAADAARTWTRNRASARQLLVSVGAVEPAERAAILSAQAPTSRAPPRAGSGRADAAGHLDQASRRLSEARFPPAWLTAQVAGERARLRLAAGDAPGAVAAVDAGLTSMRSVSPGTRAEAHLLLLRARALHAAGQAPAGLAAGREAVAMLARQSESPGMPPDVAASHLDALMTAWTAQPEPALAAEFLETMALAWDGAAARSAAQLAARLASREAAGEARTFQDAERGYRAALVRRQRLSNLGDAAESQIAQADADLEKARLALDASEAALRASSPRFLELLSPKIAAKDLQAVLRPDEGYLRIVLTAAGGYGVLSTPAGVRPYRIALSEAKAEALAASLRKSTQLRGQRLPDYDLDSAQALYAALIAPVADEVAGLRRLHVDAGGALAAVPFSALIETAPDAAALARIDEDQDYTGVAWLARRLAVSNAVGPASFVGLRRLPAPGGRDQGRRLR